MERVVALAARLEKLDPLLTRLENLLSGLLAHVSPATRPGLERWRSDAAALRFHLHPPRNAPLLTCVIGGTGTGKSTIVNRLLGVGASATSFRRTYTSGAVAIARKADDVPAHWLGVEHVVAAADRLPARGQVGALVIVPREALGDAPLADELLSRIVLVDTPDLDGDQPLHHAEADRAFRWAQAILFLVSPEKYQMTELLPYYRLAMRYLVPTLFLMNKCEEQIVLDDYRQQLRGYGFGTRIADRDSEDVKGEELVAAFSQPHSEGPPPTPVFVVPRDDAAYEPPPAENLSSLRKAMSELGVLHSALGAQSSSGLANRAGDLATRLEDKIITPLRNDRREADRLMDALHGMETPTPGVDVNPLTSELQRRLQQRSVLYLIGPQRILDRVRQAPGLLVRLPRVAWDYLRSGEVSPAAFSPDGGPARPAGTPDYRGILVDQFAVLQSRIDDLLRSGPTSQRWLESDARGYQAIRITPEQAGKIADEEIEALKDWLQKRWNATPRDTRAINSLMKHLPGGAKLTKLAETAPYLLIVALVAHHALFGTDLLVLGGYSLATWLSEKLSNEVSSHTRTTNSRISERFARLAHEQIEKFREWIDGQAPPQKSLDQLERAANELAQASGMEGENTGETGAGISQG
jgi:hypothetical protein